MNHQYEILTVDDFLKVPEDKIAACLADFQIWSAMMRKAEAVNSVIDNLTGMPGGTALIVNKFVWIDDGIEGMSRLNFMCDAEVIASINMLDAQEKH